MQMHTAIITIFNWNAIFIFTCKTCRFQSAENGKDLPRWRRTGEANTRDVTLINCSDNRKLMCSHHNFWIRYSHFQSVSILMSVKFLAKAGITKAENFNYVLGGEEVCYDLRSADRNFTPCPSVVVKTDSLVLCFDQVQWICRWEMTHSARSQLCLSAWSRHDDWTLYFHHAGWGQPLDFSLWAWYQVIVPYISGFLYEYMLWL